MTSLELTFLEEKLHRKEEELQSLQEICLALRKRYDTLKDIGINLLHSEDASKWLDLLKKEIDSK